jgi:glucose/arabinose dehydrogenase
MTGQMDGLRLPSRAFLLAAVLCAGCESNNMPPTPSPGNGTPETITGSERIGWDQPASGAAEIASFRYAIYVDGNRLVLGQSSCASAAGAAGFPCSAALPPLSPGTHVLELTAFIEAETFESARSTPLRVTVTGSTTAAEAAPLTPGDTFTTSDGVKMTATVLLESLSDVTDMALASDGRLLVAERAGSIVVHDAAAEPFRAAVPEMDGDLLAVAPAPDFARSGHLFVIQTARGVFRLCRYRLLGGQLIERLIVLPDVPAARDPSAVLRFGPDAKLYAAFDDGGSRDAAARLADWSGKLLRLNPDGRTPDDQPSASPVFWSGLAAPRGMDWSPDGGILWMAERGADRVERLRALVSGAGRRTAQMASYVLPGAVGASSLAFHQGAAVPQLRDNLFVAARDGGYLLRVSFDRQERTRAVTTEKIFEGRLPGLRAVLAGPEDALYVATASGVWRLMPGQATPK